MAEIIACDNCKGVFGGNDRKWLISVIPVINDSKEDEILRQKYPGVYISLEEFQKMNKKIEKYILCNNCMRIFNKFLSLSESEMRDLHHKSDKILEQIFRTKIVGKNNEENA